MCGVNGDTYSSKCAANSARVVVDYKGPCKAVGGGYGEWQLSIIYGIAFSEEVLMTKNYLGPCDFIFLV